MTDAERTNALLEDIRAQNRATYEGLMGAIESLERKMDARFSALEERVTVLENAVRVLMVEVTGLRKDVDELRSELRQLRHDFDHRNEVARLETLERRVELLEKRRPH
jgi:uncharacterized coiled-coil protein SlyX